MITVNIRNEQEKTTLLAFLSNLNYRYAIESDDELTNDHFEEMLKRKADFLPGKTSFRAWQAIKNSYPRP
jgi:hypothetical protein